MNLKKHSQTLSSWTGRLVACLLPLLLTLTANAGEQLYFYHTDHLGTPQVMTDDQGQVVWEGHYRPFGEVELTVEGVGSNLRFPGQYFDEESGNYYNYFRDYDPAIGRYLQSDPIGLKGSINTYGYVGGNPLIKIDPKGLSPFDDDYDVYDAWDDAVVEGQGPLTDPISNLDDILKCAIQHLYCVTISRTIAITADVVSIAATNAELSSGGAATPIALPAGVVATIVAVTNSAITVKFCGFSASAVTTAAGAFAKGKAGIGLSVLDIILSGAGL